MPEFAGTLFPFQQEDTDKLSDVPSGLNASEMGTGKTHTGIAVDVAKRNSDSKDAKLPTLVLAPLSALGMWEEKYAELAPELRTFRIDHTSKITRERIYTAEADVYIVHWDALRLLPALPKRRWLHVVADECQRAQNRKAQQTTALKRIKPIHRLGLSGTPVTSHVEKFCSVLNWMWPKDRQFSSFWRFFAEHVDFHEDVGPNGPYKVIDGYKNLDELLDYISPCYVRHLKKEPCCAHHPNGVTPWLPDKYYSSIKVDLHAPQRRAYDEMKKDMIAWVGANEQNPIVAPIAIAKITRLQQFSAGYADVSYVNGQAKVTLTEPSAKLDTLMEILRDNDTEQVVVWSQFRQMIDLLAIRLAKAGISYVSLTGGTPEAIRKQNIQTFQAGKARVFIGTIAAGGVAITLTAASTVVMLDRVAGAPTVNFQAEDRCWRIGQKNAVQVIDVMARNTIDFDRAAKLDITWGWLRKMLGDTRSVGTAQKTAEKGLTPSQAPTTVTTSPQRTPLEAETKTRKVTTPMKFSPIDVSELPQKNSRANSETGTLVAEFIASGVAVAELDPEGKKVETVRTSVQNAINRIPNGKAQVKVMSRAGRLFLTRIEPTAADTNGTAEPEAPAEG